MAAHDFPPGFEADGLLGLDFFRGRVLTVVFLRGTVALLRPWRWFMRR